MSDDRFAEPSLRHIRVEPLVEVVLDLRIRRVDLFRRVKVVLF